MGTNQTFAAAAAGFPAMKSCSTASPTTPRVGLARSAGTACCTRRRWTRWRSSRSRPATSLEFGHSAGAVVSATIKSGTNQFHGAVFEFLRNNDLDATNFFTNAVGQAKSPYHQNQFASRWAGCSTFRRFTAGTTARSSSSIIRHAARHDGRADDLRLAVDGVPRSRFLGAEGRHLRPGVAADRTQRVGDRQSVPQQSDSGESPQRDQRSDRTADSRAQFRRARSVGARLFSIAVAAVQRRSVRRAAGSEDQRVE